MCSLRNNFPYTDQAKKLFQLKFFPILYGLPTNISTTLFSPIYHVQRSASTFQNSPKRIKKLHVGLLTKSSTRIDEKTPKLIHHLSEAEATFCIIMDSAARIALCDPVIVTFLPVKVQQKIT